MSQFTQYDLGRLDKGATVVVTLKGSAANVRLMDSTNFRSYKNGRKHRYVGGLAKSSPIRLSVPSNGHWYVTVDMQGLRGTVRSSVSVEPGPLPTIRNSSSSGSLDRILQNAHPSEEGAPSVTTPDDLEWDVFISHASEDKAEVARPLAEALRAQGVRVWLDAFELKIGDSLRRKIDMGLAKSRFGVVVVSPSFFAKQWPQYELDGLVTRQNSGEQQMLPIWHGITKAEVMGQSPSLADKVARSTAQFTIEEIADEIAGVVRLVEVEESASD